MLRLVDPNCSATSDVDLGEPELVYGLWYRFCSACGVYHGLTEDRFEGGHAERKATGNIHYLPGIRPLATVTSILPRLKATQRAN